MKIDIYRQDDSVEFLQKLIEQTDIEIKGKTKYKAWENVPQLEMLMLNEVFELNKCVFCSNETCNDLSYTNLDLTYANNTIMNTTTTNAIKEIFKTKEQCIPCARCKNSKVISSYTYNTQKYLWLRISRNRINPKNDRIERANHRIKPEIEISIRKETPENHKNYIIFGGIVHIGGANSGHYIYITRKDNLWYSISDAKVEKITETEAINQLERNATLLGYSESREILGKNLASKISKSHTQPNTNSQNPQHQSQENHNCLISKKTYSQEEKVNSSEKNVQTIQKTQSSRGSLKEKYEIAQNQNPWKKEVEEMVNDLRNPWKKVIDKLTRDIRNPWAKEIEKITKMTRPVKTSNQKSSEKNQTLISERRHPIKKLQQESWNKMGRFVYNPNKRGYNMSKK
jgi:predicted GNAT family N-acyltransferase